MQRNETPDDQGWYWCEDKSGRWFMAYVSTESEMVGVWDGDDPMHAPARFNIDAPNVTGCVRWIGPLECPGGPFHSAIHEFDAEQHDSAKADGKVLVALVADFTHADSPQGQIVASGQMTVDEAWSAIKKTFPKAGGD